MFPAFQPDPDNCTRYLFFTGKGGVGKTSLACATALRLADAGRRVLLVSTDPASNLDEVLGVGLARDPRNVTGSLFALNIDPVEAAAAYRERAVGPLRGVLPEAAIRSMEESLSGSCTVEIAAFEEFTSFIGAGRFTEYDHVVFDTAPTGHTLRLMGLANAWDQFLETNTTGASCLGPLAGLEKQKAACEATVRALADASLTTVILVARAQSSSLREAGRASGELRATGIANQQIVINGIFRPSVLDDAAEAFFNKQEEAIGSSEGFLASLPVSQVPLLAENILGFEGLRALLNQPVHTHPVAWASSPCETGKQGVGKMPACLPNFVPVEEILDFLAAPGHGVILTMGKGGVGKTSIAAAIAVELAHRGYSVHLSTTDPAAHLSHALEASVPGLEIGRIDPAAETADYRKQILADAGAGLNAGGRALLEEDLKSPCTEEIAVFRAFSREVAKGEDKFVVLDTAPTGHTLLLLDAAETFHRELGRQTREGITEDVRRLLPRLRDPAFTRILLVTLPEATPVHEAAALQDDLRRAGIEPFAWVVNQSFLNIKTSDSLLLLRAKNEIPFLAEVSGDLASKATLLPWLTTDPTGPDALRQWLQSFPTQTKHQ